MKNEYNFHPIEENILRLLFQTKVPLTAYEIAKELKISYPTAKKYADKLSENHNVIIRRKEKKIILKVPLIKKIKKDDITIYSSNEEILSDKLPEH